MMGSLFDCSFKHFITPKIIRIVYVLAIIAFAIIAIGMIVKGFEVSEARGVLTLIIGAPLYFIITVILTRIWLELIMIIFRIGDDVAKLAGREICEKKEEAPAECCQSQPPAQNS
jgi:hypothetical protein